MWVRMVLVFVSDFLSRGVTGSLCATRCVTQCATAAYRFIIAPWRAVGEVVGGGGGALHRGTREPERAWRALLTFPHSQRVRPCATARSRTRSRRAHGVKRNPLNRVSSADYGEAAHALFRTSGPRSVVIRVSKVEWPWFKGMARNTGGRPQPTAASFLLGILSTVQMSLSEFTVIHFFSTVTDPPHPPPHPPSKGTFWDICCTPDCCRNSSSSSLFWIWCCIDSKLYASLRNYWLN